jgi:hypothetical protein
MVAQRSARIGEYCLNIIHQKGTKLVADCSAALKFVFVPTKVGHRTRWRVGDSNRSNCNWATSLKLQLSY